MREKIDLNYRKIKTTRAVTYVFDILILMIAGLYIFNIDFAKWLLIPASGSVHPSLKAFKLIFNL